MSSTRNRASGTCAVALLGLLLVACPDDPPAPSAAETTKDADASLDGAGPEDAGSLPDGGGSIPDTGKSDVSAANPDTGPGTSPDAPAPIPDAITDTDTGAEAGDTGAAQGEDTAYTATTDAETPEEGMAFLKEPGQVNEAMKLIWDQGFADPADPEEASEAMAERQAAAMLLLQNEGEAHAALEAAFGTVKPPDYSTYASLVSLLRLLGNTPPLIGAMRDVVVAEPLGDTLDHDVPPDELARQVVLDVLLYHARKGSEDARDALLEAVQAPDLRIAATAVRCFYLVSPERREAQREMRETMNPERHWLLYRF